MKTTFERKAKIAFAEWILADLELQTDKGSYFPYCCHIAEASARVAALALMYVRGIEQAEQLGLVSIGKATQTKQWIETGVLKVL